MYTFLKEAAVIMITPSVFSFFLSSSISSLFRNWLWFMIIISYCQISRSKVKTCVCMQSYHGCSWVSPQRQRDGRLCGWLSGKHRGATSLPRFGARIPSFLNPHWGPSGAWELRWHHERCGEGHNARGERVLLMIVATLWMYILKLCWSVTQTYFCETFIESLYLSRSPTGTAQSSLLIFLLAPLTLLCWLTCSVEPLAVSDSLG